MKALANDAEIDGMVDKANEYIIESIEQNEALNEKLLDAMWQSGIKKGHEIGVDAGYAPGYNKGLIEGLLAGWSDAKGFKTPNRVYDLGIPSIKPIAEGVNANELARKIPDTIENRLWRANTDKMAKKGPDFPLSNFSKIKDEPFVYHHEQKRLGINLNEFMKSEGVVQGKDAKIVGNGQTTLTSVTKTKEDVIKSALGDRATKPTGIGKIPQRPIVKPEFRQPKSPQVVPADSPKTPKTPFTPTKSKRPKKLLIAPAPALQLELDEPKIQEIPDSPTQFSPAVQAAIDSVNDNPEVDDFLTKLLGKNPK